MASVRKERVLNVEHWNERLFSFTTTRDQSFRFESGHFVMVGLEQDNKPLMRAFSIASPNYADNLEFLSIKIANGPLTSKLQHIQPGDEVIVSAKPVGTLVMRDLHPGKNLYLFATGTGLAPFLSIIRDPETYERFEKVILAHGVRHVTDLAFADYITEELPRDEFLGDLVTEKLIYYPTVTREDFRRRGRITQHIESGDMFRDIGLPPLNPAHDRAMICGSMAMLDELSVMLNARGFKVSPNSGVAGDYVIERAFAEK